MLSALGPSAYLQAGVNLALSIGWRGRTSSKLCWRASVFTKTGNGEESQKGVLLKEMQYREGRSVFSGPRGTSENGLASLYKGKISSPRIK